VIEIKRQLLNPSGARSRSAAAAVLTALALAFPVTAAGADPECDGPIGDQYCPDTQLLTASGSGGQPDSSSGGGLPFTGFDIALSLAAGAGLLGAGLALHRASRPGPTS
jgi:hypothetical protein